MNKVIINSFLIFIFTYLTLTNPSFSKPEYTYGYIDELGKVVIDIQNHMAYDFKDGRAAVYKDGKWCWIDKTGKYILKPEYEEIIELDTEDLFAGVRINRKWGIIDKKGKFIINPSYDELYTYDNITNEH